jgi:hypothetical protein
MTRKRSSQRFEADDHQHERRSSLLNDEYEYDMSEGDDISKFNKRVQSVLLIEIISNLLISLPCICT